jgi:hypothetical protein
MPRPKPTSALVLLLLLPLAVAPPARAQSARSASLGGAVTDSSGAPVAASVTLSREESGYSRTVTAPRDGRFSFSLLPPGEYSLRAEQFGYRPVVVRGILLRRGQELNVPVALTPVAGAATSVDTVTLRGALLAGTGPALTVPLPASLLAGYPEERREVTGLGRYSSLADEQLGMQGLPAAYSGVRVDGVAAATMPSPALVPGSLRAAAYPIGMFESATLVATDPDVEWSGFSGGSLDGYAWRGGRETSLQAFGSWSGSALSSGWDGPDAGSYQTPQGGVRLSGAIIPDTASYVVGVEAWRLAAPLPIPLGIDPAQALAVARETYGVEGADGVGRTEVVSAYGGFSWQLSDATSLDVRVNGAAIPSSDGGIGAGSGTAPILPSYSGRDLAAGLLLTGRLGSSAYQELEVSWSTTGRDYDATDALGLGASTEIASAGVTLGPWTGAPRSYDRSLLHVGETVHLRRGAHRLKLGATVGLASFSTDPATLASYYFSDTTAFAAGTGAYVYSRPAGKVSFGTPRGALFLQDTWRGSPGLELLGGVRVDAERLPSDEATPNAAWFRATGMVNTDLHSTWIRVSPRIGFSWDVRDRHEWVISGSGGLYSGETDPLLLSGWIEGSRAEEVRRGFGSLAGWPGAPAEVADDGAPRLTLIDPSYAPPRTLRGNLGVHRALGSGTVVRVAGLFRYTDLLPRFADLNLAPSAAGTDQFGRPLLGALEQHGALLVAERGTNRRFVDFDQVTAINLDGWSRYAGLLLGFQHHSPGGLDLFGSYTYSRTEDNWVPASGTELVLPTAAPVPDGGDWLEGRSAYDVPHRLTLGAETAVPGLSALRLGLLYRYRSGRPFTPGFRAGVDANGDGVPGNDPAPLDATIPGLSEQIAAWSCLGGQSGGLAERNSCRTDGVQTLDARLSLRFLRLGGVSARLVLDGLNLLADGDEVPDRALLLVDPAGSLSTDPATGVTTVPLVANPHFGQPLGTLGGGRVLRVGLQLSY